MTLWTCALLELEERRPMQICHLEVMMANCWRKNIEIDDRESEDIVDDNYGVQGGLNSIIRPIDHCRSQLKCICSLPK